jgi:hypothetical protein
MNDLETAMLNSGPKTELQMRAAWRDFAVGTVYALYFLVALVLSVTLVSDPGMAVGCHAFVVSVVLLHLATHVFFVCKLGDHYTPYPAVQVCGHGDQPVCKTGCTVGGSWLAAADFLNLVALVVSLVALFASDETAQQTLGRASLSFLTVAQVGCLLRAYGTMSG